MLVDAGQIAADAEQFNSTDAEQRRDVVVGHRDLQIERVIHGARVGTDQETVVGRRVDVDDVAAVLEERRTDWTVTSLYRQDMMTRITRLIDQSISRSVSLWIKKTAKNSI